MKHTSSLSQLVHGIAIAHKAKKANDAECLFLELYARVRDHLYRMYRSVLFNTFNTADTTVMAEEVYQIILDEIERELRNGKVEVKIDAPDTVVIKQLAKRVGLKAYFRLLTAMKQSKKKSVYQAADLAPHVMEQIPDSVEVNADDEELMTDGIRYVFANLADRDADLLRTMHYSSMSEQEAKELLMQRYDLSEAAFEKAVWRAKKQFKQLWKQYLSKTYTSQTTTNIKLRL